MVTYVLPVAVAAVLIGVPLRRILAAIRRPHAAAVFAEGLSARDEDLLRTALPAPAVTDAPFLPPLSTADLAALHAKLRAIVGGAR